MLKSKIRASVRLSRLGWPLRWMVAASILSALAALPNRGFACGPFFPNWLLAQGDQAVLVAPEGNFAAELARMNLGRSPIRALPPEQRAGHAAQSMEAELADLRRALRQAGTPAAELGRICSEHQRQREVLTAASEELQRWKNSHADRVEAGAAEMRSPERQPPLFPNLTIVHGLPNEFADYFEGFVAWHNPNVADKQASRAAWERLLARPETERKYKSTWAAFMLGKSWEGIDDEKAVRYFQDVRALVRQGFRDSAGLAAASLGLEARIYLRQKKYDAAIGTYLEQLATGDPTATNSLATASAKALVSGAESLRLLASQPRTRDVITAFVISRPSDSFVYTSTPSDEAQSASPGPPSQASVWLGAVESANVRDVTEAEALALAAYRANEMDRASRWIKRAPNSALAQWLQAKLLLRAGKLQPAAALLAKLSPRFPIIHEGTNAPAPSERKDTLVMAGGAYCWAPVSAERQVQGELGVLRLARGEYVQALDSLLNAGFWMDAAYVAERVLSLEELKDYVDRFWPAASANQVAEEEAQWGESELCPALLRENVRYLLARRLTRELHGDQARDYYPAAWQDSLERLAAALRTGWDQNLEATNRAAALFQAALITRTNGLELFGTEVAPDWRYHHGDFDDGVTGDYRSTNELAAVVRPSKDELRRDSEHRPEPDLRFHYRYQAAALAWEAAKLMPDNNDQTAYVLWKGGSFLKYRDPQTADIFYKALVRRNRQTALGAEADRVRWFPVLDENGNIIPKKAQPTEAPELSSSEQMVEPDPQAPGEAASPEAAPEVIAAPAPPGAEKGYEYLVKQGDSLPSIARHFTEIGVPVDAAEILGANPGLNSAKLKIGQKLFIPAENK